MKRTISNISAALFGFSFLLLGTGCNKHPVPDDLPPLFPCKITLTQEGRPFEGATVTLMSDRPPEGRHWIIGGRTGKNGEADLVTQPHFPGVPEGTYKVLVGKTEVDDSEVPKYDDSEAYAAWELKTKGVIPLFSLINPVLDIKKKTPFKITVVKGNNLATFEVGKPIRVRIN